MKKYKIKVGREYLDVTLEELTEFFREAEIGMCFEIEVIGG